MEVAFMSRVDDLFELIKNNGYTAETKIEMFKEDAEVLLPLGKRVIEYYNSFKGHCVDELGHYNKLKEESDIMNDINVIVRAEIERKKKYIEDNKYKAEFYDLVAKTNDVYSIDEIANILEYTPQDIESILRFKHLLLKRENEPTTVSIDRGLLRYVIDTVTLEAIPVATKKGLEYIKKVINNLS